MKLLRKIAVLTGICFSTSLQAATEFENGLVPLELARETSGGTWYKTLPDNFPVPNVPPALGLGVIGSIDRGSQQQVLLRNVAPGQAVRDALQAAYLAAGWINLPMSPGFLMLCHDQLGSLQIRSTDVAPGEFRTHVTRTTYPSGYAGAGTCAEQLESIQSGGTSGIFGFFQALMPVLEVPEGTVVPAPAPSIGIRGTSGSISGGNIEMTNDGSIEVPAITAAELHQHFALQLQDQGWAADSDVVGARSSASVWYRTTEALPIPGQTAEEEEYTLVMTLLNTAEDTWRVTVKLQAGTGSSGSFSYFGGGLISRDLFLTERPLLQGAQISLIGLRP